MSRDGVDEALIEMSIPVVGVGVPESYVSVKKRKSNVLMKVRKMREINERKSRRRKEGCSSSPSNPSRRDKLAREPSCSR